MVGESELNAACSQCGASLEVRAVDRLLTCRFCGAALVVDAGQFMFNEVLKPTLTDPSDAQAHLSRHLDSEVSETGFHRRSKIDVPRLEYFPFWVFAVETGGAEAEVCFPAAATVVQGLQGWRLPAGQRSLVSELRAGGASIVEPDVPCATARRWLEVAHHGARIERTLLVHVPLYTVRYQRRGRTHQAVVDGVSGKMFLTETPRRDPAPYLAVIVLALVVFGTTGALCEGFLTRIGAFLAVTPPLLGLTWLICRRL